MMFTLKKGNEDKEIRFGPSINSFEAHDKIVCSREQLNDIKGVILWFEIKSHTKNPFTPPSTGT